MSAEDEDKLIVGKKGDIGWELLSGDVDSEADLITVSVRDFSILQVLRDAETGNQRPRVTWIRAAPPVYSGVQET
jgi:hypothetical protein